MKYILCKDDKVISHRLIGVSRVTSLKEILGKFTVSRNVISEYSNVLEGMRKLR